MKEILAAIEKRTADIPGIIVETSKKRWGQVQGGYSAAIYRRQCRSHQAHAGQGKSHL